MLKLISWIVFIYFLLNRLYILCSSSSDGGVDGEADDEQQQDVEDAEDGQPAVLGALTNQR